MICSVYLASKVGQVTGKGLFGAVRDRYPRWVLYSLLTMVVIANTIAAGADIGGMAAAVGLLVAVPAPIIVCAITALILGLQIFGSYALIKTVFRWMALALLAYIGAAVLSRPDWSDVFYGTVTPRVEFSFEFFSLIVAVIGTTLSGYLYSWQSNQEVEEEVDMGRRRLADRLGATRAELKRSRRDIAAGMVFSVIVLYSIVVATGSTLHQAGQTRVRTAADIAGALTPLAGNASSTLFAIGLVGVGFLAVPVLTTGVAYNACQTFGWKDGLRCKPAQAKRFYAIITASTLAGMSITKLGFTTVPCPAAAALSTSACISSIWPCG